MIINALSQRAVDVLKGKIKGDIREVSVNLAAGLVSQIKGIDDAEALELCNGAIDNGSAFLKFKQWISAQGADARFADNTELFAKCKLKSNSKRNNK